MFVIHRRLAMAGQSAPLKARSRISVSLKRRAFSGSICRASRPCSRRFIWLSRYPVQPAGQVVVCSDQTTPHGFRSAKSAGGRAVCAGGSVHFFWARSYGFQAMTQLSAAVGRDAAALLPRGGSKTTLARVFGQDVLMRQTAEPCDGGTFPPSQRQGFCHPPPNAL